MTRISTIITTHNRATLLPRALQSVVAQTRPADEIIVVDDGSTDNTRQLVENYPATIKYVHQEQAGISAARNHAIQQASGDWLAFLDDDDSWHPDKLARQLKAIELSPEHRLCHTEEIWIRGNRRVNAMNKHQKQGGLIYPNCLPLCVISPSSAMIHRRVFETIGLFDETLPVCEDYDLWLRICAQEPVLFIDQPLITKYGGHEDQLSRKYWGMDRFRITALEKMLTEDKLNETYRRLTLEMLIEKMSIYIQGAEKRGKHDEVAQYRQRLHRHQQALSQDHAACC